ncbi:pirin family protein [Foetidibacter luteolus]|uniref:pirin family protein n=1 Tax=Foetidibacter luteolus TaxID=2608880 RepID=UPI00129A3F8E|nr:pirin family protein [Foetidibacter luteolus]
MKNRSIQHIIYAATYNMGGFPVRQPLPSAQVNNLDPFLLLHHADVKVPENVPVNKAGVGPHPHRGFSPVTFIFKGGVHHRDSRGNNNVIYAGGTQWMNAGMGIIHSERPPHDIHEIGGRQEIIQLWVNSPASEKMKQPVYYPATAEEIPHIISNDGLVTINIVSGSFNGVKGPVPASTEVNTFTAEFKAGGKHFINIPANHNAFIYLLDGKLLVNGSEVKGKYAVVFNNDGDGFELEAAEDTRLFIGSGLPLNEKIASHGPFVMNTETELLEAFRDYEMGKMGVLIED